MCDCECVSVCKCVCLCVYAVYVDAREPADLDDLPLHHRACGTFCQSRQHGSSTNPNPEGDVCLRLDATTTAAPTHNRPTDASM